MVSEWATQVIARSAWLTQTGRKAERWFHACERRLRARAPPFETTSSRVAGRSAPTAARPKRVRSPVLKRQTSIYDASAGSNGPHGMSLLISSSAGLFRDLWASHSRDLPPVFPMQFRWKPPTAYGLPVILWIWCCSHSPPDRSEFVIGGRTQP